MVTACIRDMMYTLQADRPFNDEEMLRLCERLLRWFSVNSKNSVFHARIAALVQNFHRELEIPMEISETHKQILNAMTLMREGVTLPELMERSRPQIVLDSDL